MVVLILLKSFLQNFQPQRQWCIKFLLPWAQKCYTPLALGRGSKCPWQFFPPAVVVYKIVLPAFGAFLVVSVAQAHGKNRGQFGAKFGVVLGSEKTFHPL